MRSYYSEFARSVFVERCAHKNGNKMSRFHYHDCYEIFLLESGETELFDVEKRCVLKPGDAMIFSPYQFHRVYSEIGYERTCIYITERFLSKYYTAQAIEILTGGICGKKVTLGKDEYMNVQKQSERILLEDSDGLGGRAFLYAGDILLTLSSCAESLDAVGRDPGGNISRTLEYISENYRHIKDIDEIAEYVHLTKYHLCRMFKREVGITLISYLNYVKIQRACELLITTELSVTETAVECGFNSSVYFSSVFKRVTGQSPNEFRKNPLSNRAFELS